MPLLKSRRSIPAGSEHNFMRRITRRQVKMSVQADRDVWWIQKAKEMEEARKVGNARRLFQLVHGTGPRKPLVGETMKGRNGVNTSNKEERLDQWAEYFEQQLSWRPSGTHLEPTDVVEILSQRLSDLFYCIWEKETLSDNCGQSVIVPIFKKRARSECDNCRGVSLTPIVTRLLMLPVLLRLMLARETLIGEQQAGFRPGEGRVDQILAIHQVLEPHRAYKRHGVIVLLDFQGAFDSVDRSVLVDTLAHQGMSRKFVNIDGYRVSSLRLVGDTTRYGCQPMSVLSIARESVWRTFSNQFTLSKVQHQLCHSEMELTNIAGRQSVILECLEVIFNHRIECLLFARDKFLTRKAGQTEKQFNRPGPWWNKGKQFAYRITLDEDVAESTPQRREEDETRPAEMDLDLKENSPIPPEYQFDAEGRASLPDGTPVVEPVSVDGKGELPHKKTKLQRTLRSSRLSNAGVLDVVRCTACATVLQIAFMPLKVHPVLRVITCKRCAKFYARQSFKQDGAGNDENCRWCGDGGDLICCDTCSNAFCKRCIKRNLGRSALSDLEALGDDDVWKCVVCDPSPIRRLQNQCSEVMKEVKEFRAFQRLRNEKRQEDNRLRVLTTEQKPIKPNEGVESSSTASTLDQRSSQCASQSTPLDTLSSIRPHIGRVSPKVRHCNLGYLPVASTPIHSVTQTTSVQPKPVTCVPVTPTEVTPAPTASFDVLSILTQINNVNVDNIRVALRATRRCIETFSSDIRQLETRSAKASHPGELPPIVRAFQSSYRFHLFARLANLEARMREEVPRPLNTSTVTLKMGPNIGSSSFGRTTVTSSRYKRVTIDLTHDNPAPPAKNPNSATPTSSASAVATATAESKVSTLPVIPDATTETIPRCQEILDLSSNESDTSTTNPMSVKIYEPALKRIRTDRDESLATSSTKRIDPNLNSGENRPITLKTEADNRPPDAHPSLVVVNEPQPNKDSLTATEKSQIKTELAEEAPQRVETIHDPNEQENLTNSDLVTGTETVKNGNSSALQPPIQESSVRLEDIRHCIGDTSVVDLREASRHGLPPDLVASVSGENASSSEPGSDADLDASVLALERACAKLTKSPDAKSSDRNGSVNKSPLKLRNVIYPCSIRNRRLWYLIDLKTHAETQSYTPPMYALAPNTETHRPRKLAKRKRKRILETVDGDWSIEEELQDQVSDGEASSIKDLIPADETPVDQQELRSALLDQAESDYRSDMNYRARLLQSSSDDEDEQDKNEDSEIEGSAGTEEALEEHEEDVSGLKNTQKSSKPATASRSKNSEQSIQSDKEETPAESEKREDKATCAKPHQRTKTTDTNPDRWFSSDDSDSEPSSSSSSDRQFFDTSKRQFRRTNGKFKKISALDSEDSSSGESIKPRKAPRKLAAAKPNEVGSSDEGMRRKYHDKSGKRPTGPRHSDESDPERKGRKKIRKIYTKSHLSQSTKTAEAEERERRRRIGDRQKTYNDWVIQEGEGIDVVTKKLILEKPTDESSSSSATVIRVHSDILKHLKPHQVEAVRFLWDCVIESVERQQKSPNDYSGGAILAHCMGLGKSLSIIAFIHTLFSYVDVLNLKSCLIICPVNTLLNWKHEWEHWLPEEEPIDIFELASKPDKKLRVDVLKHWFRKGGVLLIGYDMFRNFVNGRKATRSKANREAVKQALVDPGPDIVICDEGHMLKNDKSGLSKAVSQIRTLKRVVLTGTPLQNNLNEYHAMVNFVKPNLLGTAREFNNRFGNPIRNGQHSNSTERDVKLMKRRAHVLYKMLDGCVQRKDYNALTKYLPPRYEYVVMCRLSEAQRELYQTYLRVRADRLPLNTNYRGEETRQTLFRDQQTLYRVWTHPFLLRSHETREAQDNDEESTDLTDASDTTEETINSGSSCSDTDFRSGKLKTDEISATTHKRRTRSNKNNSEADDNVICLDSSEDTQQALGDDVNSKDPWWYKPYKDEYDWCLEVGGKLEVLFHILKKCTDIGDKVIVFTQSLLSLDLLERFLGEIHRQPDGESTPRPDLSRYFSDVNVNTWVRGHDYERMDGSMNAVVRKNLQHRFNRVSNTRLRLFLISTRAGGLGINLTAANRLILFDACWNPSHDIQSIFRCYRFGQTKPVYIYRLIAQGTMEEKIYDRQVTKQSLSLRVIDEQQIDRHFTMADLLALYSFDPDIWVASEADKRPTPKLPKDRLLADMLSEFPHLIVNYHEHDSLLAHREDEGLTETERQEAWREYEEEKALGMSLAQHQRLLQQQEIMAQNQQHLQYFRTTYQPPTQQLPPLEPRAFPPSINPYYQYGSSNFMRNINPTAYPPPIPRHPVEPPPIPPPTVTRIPNSGMPYMELFDKYRSYVLKNRPSLAADPIQLENTVLSYIMDSLSKQARVGQSSTSAATFGSGQPGRSL
ncbi:transcriptional regulator ATRX [Clonorchis sinensis]|uniref:ATP-dependent helicase ATRX n=1 Tax=Clonorchis sinensis TaxID=79923 RepID=G7YVN9_CLOSI|nr:transcriptional regulator ATRX [Clonorchis sinensis]